MKVDYLKIAGWTWYLLNTFLVGGTLIFLYWCWLIIIVFCWLMWMMHWCCFSCQSK